MAKQKLLPILHRYQLVCRIPQLEFSDVCTQLVELIRISFKPQADKQFINLGVKIITHVWFSQV
jgi:hypothetical protein